MRLMFSQLIVTLQTRVYSPVSYWREVGVIVYSSSQTSRHRKKKTENPTPATHVAYRMNTESDGYTASYKIKSSTARKTFTY